MFWHLGLADFDRGYARCYGKRWLRLLVDRGDANLAVKLAIVRRHRIGYRYVAWSRRVLIPWLRRSR